MTNKKFKFAAMSMALTACVAAQPLLANAAETGSEPEASADLNLQNQKAARPMPPRTRKRSPRRPRQTPRRMQTSRPRLSARRPTPMT